MGKSEQIKEKIIEITIELINKSNGNVENITIRDIAEKSGVGTGLINYHFKAKEKLIEECIQRMIGDIIHAFHPRVSDIASAADRVKIVAKQVVDILVAKPEISRISILGDMVTPKITDNTMNTVAGFTYSTGGNVPEAKLLSFLFTMILQGTFLRKDMMMELFGYDFNNKEDRDAFLDSVIDQLYGGK